MLERPGSDSPWCLRLLVSIDLVGSTQLKQHGGTGRFDSVPWPVWFEVFYRGVEGWLDEAYAAGANVALAPLATWKLNGDEVLLEAPLRRCTDAVGHLQVLRRLLREFRTRWKEAAPHEVAADRPFPMDLKAAAWVAGFPVRNIRTKDSEGRPADLIGPEIDLGFRLARLARRDRITIDAGLALVLAIGIRRVRQSGLRLAYCGGQVLPGILDGNAYPVFAVPIGHPVDDAERVLGRALAEAPARPRPREVEGFCRRFFEHTHALTEPFIDGDPDLPLRPDGCHAALARAMREIRWEAARSNTEVDALSEQVDESGLDHSDLPRRLRPGPPAGAPGRG
ncbi:MAG: hypothetical protein IT204_16790 [Fimbriimonadaceae bacterium]|nr:hypothetical protein [Fimbriimonadaceae bacterium]